MNRSRTDVSQGLLPVAMILQLGRASSALLDLDATQNRNRFAVRRTCAKENHLVGMVLLIAITFEH